MTERRQGWAIHILWRGRILPARGAATAGRAKPCRAPKAAGRGPSCSLGHAAVRQAFPSPTSRLQAVPAHPMGFWIIQHFQTVIRVHGCEQHQPAGAERQHFPHHSELFPSINGPPRPTGRVIGLCSAAGRPNRPLDPSVSAKSGYEDPRGRATQATAASLRDLCRQRGERTDSAPCNRPPAEPQRAGKALNPPRGPGGRSPAHSASSQGSFPLPEPP